MISIMRRIYWNLHLLVSPYTAGDKETKVIGSSSLFASSTLFWMLSVYHLVARYILKERPIDAGWYVAVVFVLSTALSLYIVITTKLEENTEYVRIGVLNKKLSKLFSFSYLVGSYIVFVRYVL